MRFFIPLAVSVATSIPFVAADTQNCPDGSTSTATAGLERYFNQSQFLTVFPDAIDLYAFAGLVDAVNNAYPSFANWDGNSTADKRELAAFLAQTAHESDYFKASQEYAWESYNTSQYCDLTVDVPCAEGKRYHGRGAIMLSWNYNYYNAGEALGVDLLNDPDQVATNSTLAWMTALWYWMTPQKDNLIIHDVVTEQDGFALSTYIINGELECGSDAPNTINEQQRITYYEQMCEILDVEPYGKVSCNA